MADSKFLDKEGLEYYHGKVKAELDKKVDVVEGKGLSTNDFSDEYKQIVDDLNYKPMAINSFTNNVNTVEMGSTVNDVTLSWAYNKTPKSATLDSAPIEASATSKVLSSLGLKTNKTWTLSATDERDKTVNKTTAITFLNGVYWGIGDASPTLDSAFILTLTKGLQSSKAKTFTVNAGAGKHIYYAVPTRYGTCTFKVGGFDGGFTKAGTIEFTNASGYKENYDVYKSDHANLGNTTVTVS